MKYRRKKSSKLFTLLLFAMAISCCMAVTAFAANTPDVKKHTKEEIKAYIENDRDRGISMSSPISFSEEPVTQAPYAAGKLSNETQAQAVGMLNQVRYIAGLSNNVSTDSSYIEMTQTGALINYVNRSLSHYPTQPAGMADDLYQLGYQGCNEANIAMSSVKNTPITRSIVTGWMADDGANNLSTVGHRRWCLNPSMGKTGFGAVTGTNGTYANMYSFDRSASSSVNTVVWPAQVMPAEYFGASYPWSISSDTAFPSSVSITLTRDRDDRKWTFSSSASDGYFTYNQAGYGQPYCLIFRPSGVGSYQDGDIFHVSVRNGNTSLLSYDVVFFTLTSVPDTAQAYFKTSQTVVAVNKGVMEFLTVDGSFPATQISVISDDESIAQAAVDEIQEGQISVNITGISEGETDVTIALPNGYTSKCHVKVLTAAHQHTYVEMSYSNAPILKEATCTENGYRAWKVCECGAYNGYYTIGKKPHTLVTIPGKAASCEEDGLTDGQKCSVCNHIETEQELIPALGHAYGNWIYDDSANHKHVCSHDSSHVEYEAHSWDEGKITKQATCTETGIRTYTCTVCKGTRTEAIATIPHTEETIPALAATCTETGLTAGIRCSVCKTILKEQTVTDKLGHDYKVTVTEPTCEESGFSTHVCSRCGDTYEDQKTDPLGHRFGQYVKLDEEYHTRSCLRDGCEYTEKTSHDWDDGRVTKEASCKETGVRVFTCKDCQAEREEPIDKLTHTPAVHIPGKDASCEEPGLTDEIVCSECNEILQEQEEIPAPGHQYGEWVPDGEKVHTRVCERDRSHTESEDHVWDQGKITKQATCTETGIRTYTCIICDGTRTEIIDKTPHTEETIPAVDATCTETGRTAGIRCSVCKTILKEQTVTDKLGHDYKVTVTEPTCEESGFSTHVCSRCGDTYKDQETEPLGHDYKTKVIEPSCEEDCYTLHTCSRCQDTYTDQKTKMTGHKYGSWEYDDQNRHVRICRQDPEHPHYQYGDHQWDQGKTEKEATVSEKGKLVYTCEICHGTRTETIPKLVPADTASEPEPTDTASQIRPDDTAPATKPADPASDTKPADQTAVTKPADPASDTKPADQTAVTKPADPADADNQTAQEGDKEQKTAPASAALPENQPLSVETAPEVRRAEKAIVKITGNGDPKGSRFSILQARAKKVTKKSVTLSWTRVMEASGYIIYGNQCGKKNKYVKIAEIKKGNTVRKTIKKIGKKKIKKGTYYKLIHSQSAGL